MKEFAESVHPFAGRCLTFASCGLFLLALAGCGSAPEEMASEHDDLMMPGSFAGTEAAVEELPEPGVLSDPAEAVAAAEQTIEEQPAAYPAPSGPVRGTVGGAPFEVDSVSRAGPGMFTMRHAPGAENDALLFFFFFPDEGEDLEGKTYTRTIDDGQYSAPHVHVHFRNQEGERTVEMLMGGYDLEAHFGEPVGEMLPATIRFDVPKIDLSLEGAFEVPVLRR